ncbi:MAG: T9SS type A sorting domain-containing protein [Ignavibacteria bacterium]|nr:T9SS type A sorting domain-containing protein [Ignavibacteria bacterium]
MKKVFLFVSVLSCFIFPHISYSQLVSDFKVNTDASTYNQNNSKIGVDKDGNFVVVWEDKRRSGYSDVYFQRFNMSGAMLGENTKINYTNYLCGSPEIVMKSNGNFFVCWYEYNGSANKIKLKYFNNTGDSLSNTINFIDNLINQAAYYSLGLSQEGSLIVSWTELPFTVYFQRFDSTGNKIGGNVAATDTVRDKSNSTLCIRNDGSFIICYEESRLGGGRNVKAKLFDKNGNSILTTNVNDSIGVHDQYTNPSVSADSLGRFCVAFNMYDFNANSNSVLYQLFNKDGSKKGNNVDFGSSGFEQYSAIVFKKTNGEMLLSYRAGVPRIYMRKTDSSGNHLGNQFQVSTEFPSALQYYTDYEVSNNRVITTWTDTRYGNLDVFCNIRSYINPDSTVGIHNISTEIPEDFKLYQNYPNPFNPETTIKFDVKKAGHVRIKVFDVLGKERLVLLNENFVSGSYELKYNFSAFASGVYFYILFYNNNIMDDKKLILVK